jgi:hypothetical protein
MTEEDEAFNEIERQAKQRKESVRAAVEKPQRPWVGLTFQEQQEALLNTHSFHEALIKAEKKLKEKNT